MASEIEAAAASVDESRLREAVGNYKQGCDTKHDVGVVVAAAEVLLSCLAADRAEREERARLIDAEWCEANGGERLRDGKTWRWSFSSGRLVDPGRIEWDAKNGVVVASPQGRWAFLQVANRGDFGDLLRVLKGGAQ